MISTIPIGAIRAWRVRATGPRRVASVCGCNGRLVAAVAILATVSPFARLAGQQKVEMRHAATSEVSVRLSGSVGSLRIEGWDRDSVVVTGVVPPGVRFGGGVGGNGRGPASGIKFYLESPNDEVAGTATIELRVPRRARVWVKSGTANIDARGVTGGLDLNVIGGRVQVVASPRELQIEAMDAAVVIDGAPTWLRAKTAAGDITLHGGSSDLALTSVSGAVRVEGGDVERGRVETVTGSIWFAASVATGGALDLDSHSGAIDLALISPGNFTLTASSLTGRIENRFSRERPTAGREGRGAELSFVEGRGSARITARTFKGTITIAR